MLSGPILQRRAVYEPSQFSAAKLFAVHSYPRNTERAQTMLRGSRFYSNNLLHDAYSFGSESAELLSTYAWFRLVVRVWGLQHAFLRSSDINERLVMIKRQCSPFTFSD